MSIHIIIDGYNLMRQSHQFHSIEAMDLAAGRGALIDSLALYKRVKAHHRITVVFDGTNASFNVGNRDRLKGIDIRYSKTGELADAVIKRMVDQERQRAMVVTSDREVLDYAENSGAATINSQNFEKKMVLAQYCYVKGTDLEFESKEWLPTTKKKGPARRLPRRKRQSKNKIDKL
jgi:predicted RNA-binding protein with PIN domain